MLWGELRHFNVFKPVYSISTVSVGSDKTVIIRRSGLVQAIKEIGEG